jgi:hypothetical protein
VVPLPSRPIIPRTACWFRSFDYCQFGQLTLAAPVESESSGLSNAGSLGTATKKQQQQQQLRRFAEMRTDEKSKVDANDACFACLKVLAVR